MSEISVNLIPEYDVEKEFPALKDGEEANSLCVDMDRAKAFVHNANEFMTHLKRIVGDPDAKFADKIDTILSLNVSLIPIVLMELVPGKVIDKSRTDQANNVANMIRALEASLYKKREFEAREEVDLHHPKFQKALDWIIEGVLESLTNLGVDEQMRGNFIHDFSKRMIGFEDSANRRLKGTSFSDLDSVKNPLVRSFNEGRKE